MVTENKGPTNFTFKRAWLVDQFKRMRLDPTLKDFSNEDLQKFLIEKYNNRRLVKRKTV